MIATHRLAIEELERREVGLFRDLLKPRPRLTLSEWADEYRYLSAEDSSEPGKWRTRRAPYLFEIQNTFSDPLVRRVCWMAGSQVGKTQSANNLVGYHIDQDPAPILFVHSSLDVAESWSKDRFAPMVRDTPRLHGKVKDPRSRDSGNTLLHKNFPGGHLTAVGANSPAGLASRPIRIVILDEVDRYPASAGPDGDPVSLAEQRAANFWNRKIILISTPTIAGQSRIEKEWLASDQRRFYVPCPHCNERQVLIWNNVRWEKSIENGDKIHHLETTAYECAHCHALIDEKHKTWMLDHGTWIAENPAGRFPGFHISGIYSPWVTWAELAEKFLKAKAGGPEQLKTFFNLQLGELWDDLNERLDHDSLMKRQHAEKYPAEVPAGVAVLNAGVDVHPDRLEVAVTGWGPGEESWLITHQRIRGDTEKPEVWQVLENILTRPYQHESGVQLRIRTVCIDSGYAAPVVYTFVAPRQLRGVWATKGVDWHADAYRHPRRPNKYGVRLVTISTTTFKDNLFRRLRVQDPGPGYMHFCAPTADGADAEYFRQFGGEVPIAKRVGAHMVRRYEPVTGVRNEAIDLAVLNVVALHMTFPGYRDENLRIELQRIRDEGEKLKEQQAKKPAVEAVQPAPRPRRSGGGFVNNWRR